MWRVNVIANHHVPIVFLDDDDICDDYYNFEFDRMNRINQKFLFIIYNFLILRFFLYYNNKERK